MKILEVKINVCVLFVCLFAVSLANTSVVSAQELGLSSPNKPAVVKVAAIVQYSQGKVMKTEPSGVQTEVVYQTAIYEGDRLETTRGSVLKFATRSGCVVAMRGEGGAGAPTDKKPWRFRSESLRLICNNRDQQPQTFGVANVPVSLSEGEVLFLSAPLRAMALKGEVHVRTQALENLKLYTVGDSVAESSPQPSDDSRRELNLSEKPPRESVPWPEAEKPPTVRLIFGPVFSGDGLNYDVNDLSQKNMGGSGARLQAHFRTAKDHTVIVAVTNRESCDSDSKCSGYNSKLGVNSQLEMLLLEVGYRYHHDRWWSPYFRVGAGREKARINISAMNGNSFSNSYYAYLFYVASAAFGIDANLKPKFLGPFGFYVSAEAQAVQSLWRDAYKENQNNQNGNAGGNNPGQEPFRSTLVGLVVGLGVQYEF